MSPRTMTPSGREGVTRNIRNKFSVSQRNSRSAVIVRGRQRGFATESLERAIQLVNKIILDNEQRRQRQRARRTDAKAGMEVEVQPISKPITFKASARTEKLVKEPPGPSPSSRGLSEYLALPLDQYALLDPGWISRSPTAPDVFVLRIPLFDLVGLELQPQITVRVTLDPRNSQVHFQADQFKVGDPRVDADFNLAMKATLRNKPVPTIRPLRSIKRMWDRAGGRGVNNGGAAAAAATASVRQWSAAPAAAMRPHGGSSVGGDGGTGSPAASAAADEEDEDIVAQVVEEESGQAGAGGSAGEFTDSSGCGHSHRVDRASYVSYGAYEPARVVDVDLEVRVPEPGSCAVPVAPPVGTAGVRSEEGTAAGRSPVSTVACNVAFTSNAEAAAVEGHCDNSRVRSSGSNNGSSSSSSSNHVSDLDEHRTAGSCSTSHHDSSNISSSSSAASSSRNGAMQAGPATRYAGGGGDNNGSEVRTWPQASYGPAHPAGAAAAVARADRPVGATASAAVPVPVLAVQPSPVAARPLPAAAASAIRQPAEAAAVAAAELGPLSFIEDSVLYVPANQWGRVADGQAASGTSRAAGPGLTTPVGSMTIPGGSAIADATADIGAALPRPGPGLWALRDAAELRVGLGDAEASRNGSGSWRSSSSAARRVEGSTPAEVLAESTAPRTTESGSVGTEGIQASEGNRGGGNGGGGGVSTVGRSIGGDNVSGSQPQTGAGATATAAAAVSSTDGAAAPHDLRVMHSSTTGAAAPRSMPSGAKAPHNGSRSLTFEPSAAEYADGSNSISNNTCSSSQGQPTLTAAATSQAAAAMDPPPLSQHGSEATASLTVDAVTGGGGGSAAEEGATALLVGSVDVAVTVMLPPALGTVPRPLLGMTGSLIARYAISSLLPSFLDLLVADYGRWSSGQTVAARSAPVGDLAAVAAANAAAMGAAAPGARTQQGPQLKQAQQRQQPH